MNERLRQTEPDDLSRESHLHKRCSLWDKHRLRHLLNHFSLFPKLPSWKISVNYAFILLLQEPQCCRQFFKVMHKEKADFKLWYQDLTSEGQLVESNPCKSHHRARSFWWKIEHAVALFSPRAAEYSGLVFTNPRAEGTPRPENISHWCVRISTESIFIYEHKHSFANIPSHILSISLYGLSCSLFSTPW